MIGSYKIVVHTVKKIEAANLEEQKKDVQVLLIDRSQTDKIHKNTQNIQNIQNIQNANL